MNNTEKSLYHEITESYYFSRLHDVSFLGIIDFINKNNKDKYQARFSRADHTYGVFELSSIILNKGNFNEKDCLLIISTALCHDMGHSAFSHSLEKAYVITHP